MNDTDHHNHSDDHTPDQVAPEPKPSDSDEALRLITDYADGLREYIEKLRRDLNRVSRSRYFGGCRPGDLSHSLI